MMNICSDVRASTDTGVVGVRGTSSDRQDRIVTSSGSGIVRSGEVGGFRISFRTLSGLSSPKLYLANPARMFLSVNTLSHKQLYSEVKYSLPILFIPARSNWST